LTAGRRVGALLAAVLLSSLFPAPALADAGRAADRQAMVETIRDYAAETSLYLDRDELDPRVLEVMGEVPRHELVPPARRDEAYENRPLSIGYGQTISQPYIVALMTDLLELKPTDEVLEIGTGSGYQAAVAAELAAEVYTIEIIPELHERASRDLRELGYTDVHTRLGDGYYGWPEQAPFDAIVVTAAASHIPPPLISQLRPGGRMVIPVGGRFQVQQLTVVEKDAGGEVTTRQLLPVRFVPLTGSR
jgi:protein-L-isoaspartate(D-aspartate) O-methyltransferase